MITFKITSSIFRQDYTTKYKLLLIFQKMGMCVKSGNVYNYAVSSTYII